MDKKTLLLTSGCSFTDCEHCWPYFISKKYDIDICNIATPSQGNGLISKKLIFALEQLRNIYEDKSSEIIVGVMWSGIDRSERFIESGDNYVGPPFLGYNPTEVVITNPPSKNWRMMSHEWIKSEDCVNHYEVFNNKISSMVYTIEHILRIQLYLEKNNIKYFMTTYMDIFQKELIEHSEISYLYNLIDFSKFLPIRGCHEWVKENYPIEGLNQEHKNDLHPTEFGHTKFSEEVIIPFLIKNNIV